MIDTNDLKEKIRTTIFPNGRGAINAADHQALLLDMADGMGAMNDKLIEVATDTESNNVAIEDLQDNKVDRGGYEPDLSVGVADHLAGHDEPTPSEFTFRRSGGGAILSGNARVQSVKGNSVVWNQLVQNPSEVYTNDITVAFKEGTRIVAGHKYLFFADIESAISSASASVFTRINEQNESLVTLYKSENLPYEFFVANTNIVSNGTNQSIEGNVWLYYYLGASDGKIQNTRLIDLTLMFGAGNEPTTIEEYEARKPIVADEYTYNEGEVIHMNVDAVKSVGFNQWDEKWENGIISESTGEDYDSGYAFRSKNVIRVLPNMPYYFKKPIGVVTYLMFYDDDMNFVQWLDPFATSGDGGVFTTPNAPYMRFVCYTETYNNDICINISDSEKNGIYEPYISRMQSLEILRKYFPNGMKSAGSAHDEIRYNKTSGKWEKVVRIREVDMGTLNFTRSSTSGIYYCEVPTSAIKDAKYGLNLLCARYTTHRGELAPASLPDKSLMLYNGAAYPLLGINDSAYTDVASFKAVVVGVILYYELANPIVTEIEEAFNLDYEVWNGGTEHAIADTPTSAFKADIIYGFNAYGVIKELREQLATLQAAIAKMNV